MVTIKAFIIDDEAHARTVLKSLLLKNFPEITVIGEAESIPKGMDSIHNEKPDVLFLDIEMPHFSGLQINEFLTEKRHFDIVFVTAYNQYAINAIKLSAFDYLLKPLQLHELKETIERLIEKYKNKSIAPSPEQLNALENNLEKNQPKKLVLQTHQGIHYFDLDSISHLEASGMYTIIHYDKEQFVASKPIKEFEEMLTSDFFRIHRSYIINCHQLSRYSNKEGGSVTLRNGQNLPISRNKKESFLEFLEKINQ
jgi:two-component system, LytTR family, response regulator